MTRGFSKRDFIPSLFLFTSYVVTAKLGFHTQATNKVITDVWAPTGISLAALLLFGRQLWPAIFGAALVVNWSSGVPLWISTGIATGNTLEAFMGAYALTEWGHFEPTLLRLRDVANLLLMAALLSTLFSATIGVGCLWLGQRISTEMVFESWRLWWFGDMTSNLIIAPFLLSWGSGPWKRISLRQGFEACGLTAFVIFMNGIIFSSLSQLILPTGRKGYFIFPPLVWAALRFGSRGVSFGMVLTAIFSMTGAVCGWGPFIGKSLTESMLNLQFFLSINSVTALILAAAVAERTHAEIAMQESEKRFRIAADDAPVMLWMVDKNKQCVYVNKQWQAFTGRTLAQEMGEGWIASTHCEDQVRCQSVYAQAFEGHEMFDLEYRLRHFNGDYRWVANHGSPRFSEGNRFEGYIGTCIDIHDRKMGEQELENKIEQRTSQLGALNRELEAFSYSVSHDLRTPLRAIDGFSRELMENTNIQLDHRARSDLRRVRSATQRMGQLIEDLLSFSRLSRTELKREKIDLSALAVIAMEHLRQSFPERTVEFKVAPHLVVYGDSRLLRIVVENLLANAWKFTGKIASPEIELGTNKEKDRTVYFVRDNGAGFNMQYAEKLFGVFQRLHTEKEFPGTGIGLATAQRILHRHGGQIWATAQEGQGATFFFTIP